MLALHADPTIEAILIPFITVALVEIGDKTQLSILLLSSKTEEHLHLFFGVTLAFLIVDGIAVFAGSWVANIVPLGLLMKFSGIIFIISGVLILRDNEMRDERKLYFKNSFLSGFTLILITEWCDKTQIASGLFATRYNALMVLVGTMAALALLSAMAIYLGKFISSIADKKVITKVAGIVFVLMGMTFFLF